MNQHPECEYGYKFDPTNQDHIKRENTYWVLWPPEPGDVVIAKSRFPESDVKIGDTFLVIKESGKGASGPCYACRSHRTNMIVDFWQGFFRPMERAGAAAKESASYYKAITMEEECG